MPDTILLAKHLAVMQKTDKVPWPLKLHVISDTGMSYHYTGQWDKVWARVGERGKIYLEVIRGMSLKKGHWRWHLNNEKNLAFYNVRKRPSERKNHKCKDAKRGTSLECLFWKGEKILLGYSGLGEWRDEIKAGTSMWALYTLVRNLYFTLVAKGST